MQLISNWRRVGQGPGAARGQRESVIFYIVSAEFTISWNMATQAIFISEEGGNLPNFLLVKSFTGSP